MTRRVLIVDDEKLARERMRQLLGAFDQLVIVGECANGDAAIDAVAALRPDIVFLDVQMPGADGFDVLAALDDRVDVVELPLIIFVTAFDEHATHAFEVAALDYLRKPVSRKRLGLAVSRAVAQLELLDSARAADRAPNRPVAELESKAADTYATRFAVKRGDVAHFVRPGDIDWIDAAANYVRLHVGGTAYMLRATLADVDSRLDPRQFVRVHRSAIVNLDRLARVEPFTHGEFVVVVAGGTRLRSSRAHSGRLRELLRKGIG
jgi:two-component system LytT family response regulator